MIFFLVSCSRETSVVVDDNEADSDETVVDTTDVDSGYETDDAPLPEWAQFMITGRVLQEDGKGVASVAVSDGLSVVNTDAKGNYRLPVSKGHVPKFVFISTPREYSAPVVNGLPVFYKHWDSCRGLESVDFIIERVSNPDRCTLLLPADPQIRSASARSDKVAYHSIDAMKDLFRDMREYSSGIVDRNCYGMVLGDIVHESMDLFPVHLSQCATLDFPLYSVIGNHDHDTPAVGEDAQHEPFERYLGPRNYSVGFGGFHVISLDNILVSPDGDRAYEVGVSDVDMRWLENDLSLVSKDTPLIICTHSTLFMKSTGVEVHDKARNGKAYADLLGGYDKVYNFAGHAHSSFNYVYAADPLRGEDAPLRNVEVHVVARSGGILWLNEYIANSGTPRGYVVCEIDGRDITWRYRMIPYLSGTNMSDGGLPPYSYRLWSYVDGVAYVANAMLDESCQITPYGIGAYPDGCVYANVYMWDEAWGDVYLKMDSGKVYKMERVPRGDEYQYDASEKEIYDHYNRNHSYFKDYGGKEINDVRHLFRVRPEEIHGSGTILVRDRFGEMFTAPVNW